MVTRSDAEAAQQRISGHIRRTPVLEIPRGSVAGAAKVWLKLEQLQLTGSFKARGAFNRVLSGIAAGQADDVGVVAASGGNAGLAVACAATRWNLPARVYVPETAPEVKVAKLEKLGAEVVRTGRKYAEAYAAAVADASESGALFCHAYDQPEICAGQGTLGLELLEQTGGEVDTILLAVGGGGLMAGVAAATESSARVVGVEPRTIPTLGSALAAGEPVEVDVSGVAADSLGASRIGGIAHEVAVRTGVESVLVEDSDIVAAREHLWSEYRVVVEHGTASAMAALLSGAYRPSAGERVAVVLCGANTDLTDLG
ncbi:threonine/serine dehydratase [Actinopolyspora halophila]|uniref:threonine/serine dehydratase n=1 Tax=Actinopolyspora halophila TaxID=1850 RepID=UPI00037EE9EC|nr:threonine/serine dehydratase [Actinopolyspora halophila]